MVNVWDYKPLIKNPDLPNLFEIPKYKIPEYDEKFIHVWYLDPKYYQEKIWVFKKTLNPLANQEKDMGYISPNISRLDVVFISYDELNADQNWGKVKNICPYAQRIHGIKGIFEAHKAAAKLATSDMFWVVDGDAEILPSWNFDFQPLIFDRDCVHIWKSKNSINDLVYGYGGVKLFPTSLLKYATSHCIDVTTSISNKLKIIDEISNITAFNTDPFNTWRSAFRECVKLSSNIIKNSNVIESNERLSVWTTVGESRSYGRYAIAGAKSGKKYGEENSNSPELLKLINDRDWLLEQFNKEKLYESNYLE